MENLLNGGPSPGKGQINKNRRGLDYCSEFVDQQI